MTEDNCDGANSGTSHDYSLLLLTLADLTSTELNAPINARGETEAEHAIYADDAILDYPQSGERFRGRAAIAAQRGGHPADRHFAVQRIVGDGQLWVSECVITYDGVPTYSVSVMDLSKTRSATRRNISRIHSARLPGGPRWRSRCPAARFNGADAGEQLG